VPNILVRELNDKKHDKKTGEVRSGPFAQPEAEVFDSLDERNPVGYTVEPCPAVNNLKDQDHHTPPAKKPVSSLISTV
jgi:hypothetical protein